MSLRVLKTEIEKPEYDGLTAEQIADAVNAKTVDETVEVENWQIKKHAIENGYWSAIVMGCDAGVDPAARGVAIAAKDWIDDPSGKIQKTDMDLPSTQTLVAGLVAAGFMTQPQADDLVALKTVSTPWVETVGIWQTDATSVRQAQDLV
jgi:hypothetical protein